MNQAQAETALRRIRARLRIAWGLTALTLVAIAAYYAWLVASCTRRCDPFTALMLVAWPLALLVGGLAALLTARARKRRASRNGVSTGS